MIPNPATDLVSLLNTIYSNNHFIINCLKHIYILTSEEQSLLEDLLKEININKINYHMKTLLMNGSVR